MVTKRGALPGPGCSGHFVESSTGWRENVLRN